MLVAVLPRRGGARPQASVRVRSVQSVMSGRDVCGAQFCGHVSTGPGTLPLRCLDILFDKPRLRRAQGLTPASRHLVLQVTPDVQTTDRAPPSGSLQAPNETQAPGGSLLAQTRAPDSGPESPSPDRHKQEAARVCPQDRGRRSKEAGPARLGGQRALGPGRGGPYTVAEAQVTWGGLWAEKDRPGGAGFPGAGPVPPHTVQGTEDPADAYSRCLLCAHPEPEWSPG
ncbi:uncharacterized protein LOC121040169 isoform X4 [Herpailurus yagouaroundi]|uniref:uncharacterized protein LOC121040169 isoform X4 n=1 Tax=Herpailurus yagouaroundi TaxID=1608482 RepID=UPI001AD738CB|nr:uncharacterized protein LOC121040169 isoform X4 [Puma yagouaroundi]